MSSADLHLLDGAVARSSSPQPPLFTGPVPQTSRAFVIAVPGPAGPPGPAATLGLTVRAAVDLNAIVAVKVMPNGLARRVTSQMTGDVNAVTGVTVQAARAGEFVQIRTSGALVTSAPIPIGELFLGDDGSLTTDPNTGLFALKIGYGATPNMLIVRIDIPIIKA